MNLPGVISGFGERNVPLETYLHAERGDTYFIPQTRQVHGAAVHVLAGDEQHVLEADAFVTEKMFVVCYVRTADCVPILIADPLRRVVGAVHAGWRGTAAGMATNVIVTCVATFGCDPKNIRAAIGPCIGPECYEVNLVRSNRAQLIAAGIREEHVTIANLCTACHPERFASYRRERTSDRQVSYIFLT